MTLGAMDNENEEDLQRYFGVFHFISMCNNGTC
ncbi:hypothetical protein [Neobacillus jeddahensis]